LTPAWVLAAKKQLKELPARRASSGNMEGGARHAPTGYARRLQKKMRGASPPTRLKQTNAGIIRRFWRLASQFFWSENKWCATPWR